MRFSLNDYEAALLLSVEVKKAADNAAHIQAITYLEVWTQQSVEDCAVDQVPTARINSSRVEHLLKALVPTGDIDVLLDQVISRSLDAWKYRHGSDAGVPWLIVAEGASYPDDSYKQIRFIGQ